MTDIFDKRTRSKIMSRIRSKNTKPELLLRKALRKAGLRFSTHPKMLGTPDVAFKRERIAVFVDGDFWHGYNWKRRGKKPPSGFWTRKITRNMARDKRTSQELRKNGWRVIRLWESQVMKRPAYCLGRIKTGLARHPT